MPLRSGPASLCSGDEPAIPTLLRGLGLLPYSWRIDSDSLSWAHDPSSGFGLPSGSISTGQTWQQRMAPGGMCRYAAIMGSSETDRGGGVPYRLTYVITTGAGRALGVEDRGLWYAGPRGRPALARGIIRLVHGASPSIGAGEDAFGNGPLDRAMTLAFRHAPSALLVLVDPGTSCTGENDQADALARCLRPLLRRGDSVLLGSDGLVTLVLAGCEAGSEKQLAGRLAEAAARADSQWRIMIGAARIAPTLGTEEAYRQANIALGEATRSLSGCFSLFQHRLPSRMVSDLALDGRILTALNGRELGLVLHPIIDPGTLDGFGLVARPVLRGTGRKPRPIRPVLPDIEAQGLAALVEHRTLECALQLLTQTPGMLRLPISATALGCRNWRDLLDAVLVLHPDCGLRLILDVDETELAQATPSLRKGLAAARDAGLGILVSGYGQGLVSPAALVATGYGFVAFHEAFGPCLAASSDIRFLIRTATAAIQAQGMVAMADGIPDLQSATIAGSLGIRSVTGHVAGTPVVAWPKQKSSRMGRRAA